MNPRNYNASQQEKAILVVKTADSIRNITLGKEIFVIGRHHKCSLTLEDKMISRHHATIAWLRHPTQDNVYSHWIIDGKGRHKRSTNGVMVNGIKIDMQCLEYGDQISLGDGTMITYSCIVDSTESIQLSNQNDVIYL